MFSKLYRLIMYGEQQTAIHVLSPSNTRDRVIFVFAANRKDFVPRSCVFTYYRSLDIESSSFPFITILLLLSVYTYFMIDSRCCCMSIEVACCTNSGIMTKRLCVVLLFIYLHDRMLYVCVSTYVDIVCTCSPLYGINILKNFISNLGYKKQNEILIITCKQVCVSQDE